MKAESENGAVDVGNMGLTLPVRVRACAEDVDRTVGDNSAGTQPVRASNGRNGEASQRCFAGQRVGWSSVRASTPWVKHQINPPGSICGVRECGYRLRLLWCLARSCEDNGVHSNQMKSHAVSARGLSRATAIYKARPKGCGMRRIREAVSGSTDVWDGSRAVVASREFGR